MPIEKQEILLLSVTGNDRPGIMTTITGILADYNVTILDMGQSVIHNVLNLGILLDVPPGESSAPFIKKLLFTMHNMGLLIHFTPIEPENYESWVTEQGKERYIVTLLGRKVTAEQISRTTDIIYRQGLNIDVINRLTGRVPLEAEHQQVRSCIEFSLRGTPRDTSEMKAQFLSLCQERNIDIAFQRDDIFRRTRRLVCFDMDSTLIQTEVIDEMARHAGVSEQVSALTEKAMAGEINFTESLIQRVALLKGLKQSAIKEIAAALPVTEGAHRLITVLKQYGYKTAIISGGFSAFGQVLKDRLGIDYVFCNNLEIENGYLTGHVTGRIIDGETKAKIMKELAFNEMIRLEQVIAVGDGANDLPMLTQAGLGIAFHAKPQVKENAHNAISTLGLDAILYLLGFRDRDVHDE